MLGEQLHHRRLAPEVVPEPASSETEAVEAPQDHVAVEATAETAAVEATETVSTGDSAVVDAAATAAPDAAPEMVDVWRPGGRSEERRPRHDRNRPRHQARPQEGAAPASAGEAGGEATKERLDVLRDADYILQDEIRKAGLYRDLWQSFCVLPDVRTVGVQGDERTYGNQDTDGSRSVRHFIQPMRQCGA